TPYANLSQRAVRRCQLNAIKAMLPVLDPPKLLPRAAEDVGNGYVLLPKREPKARVVTNAEAAVLRQFIAREGILASNEWVAQPVVSRWARIRLPTGQVARSLWIEEGTPLRRLRMSRNVKIIRGECVDFAEVHYYFKLRASEDVHERVFAMADVYSAPDMDLLRESSNTLWSCTRQANDSGLQVIEITDICTVVAMVPHPPILDQTLGDFTGRLFVVEKIGLDAMMLAGIEEEDDIEE
ncbi:hypothetical protein BDY19DRAFT_896329, partial [Irpex rosettiformis]